MKFKFAALSISSIPISTRMALRRATAPAKPMLNSSAERIKIMGERRVHGWLMASSVSARSGGRRSGLNFGLRFFAHGNDHRSQQRRRQENSHHFQRQDITGHQFHADYFHRRRRRAGARDAGSGC